MNTRTCASCGMICTGPEYHPYVACELFRIKRHRGEVQENLRAVVEYGMKAQKAGVSLDSAMRNVSLGKRPTEDTK